MLTIHTGPNYLMSDALCSLLSAAPSDQDVYIIVPRQLTLLTEQLILRKLNLEGSFRIQVYTSSRICSCIFNEAGYPSGDHIDDQGRVMICRRTVHEVADQLTIYRNAVKQNGFAEKCSNQLKLFIQGGISSTDLDKAAGHARPADAAKIRDLSIILNRYMLLTEGIYQDTETELIDAASNVEKASFIRNSCFFFFGFSILPPTLTDFIASIAEYAIETHILLPFKSIDEENELSCYRPVKKTISRLREACEERSVSIEQLSIDYPSWKNAIHYYSDCLFNDYALPYADSNKSVSAFTAPSIKDECIRVAALARMLCRKEGIRYGEMQILCTDPLNYYLPLKEAFEFYSVPLMADIGRPVSRVGAASMLLSALRCIADNYRTVDVISLARSEFTVLTHYETDQLENYAVHYGIEGSTWTRVFSRGTPSRIEKAESIRSRLIPPIEKLRSALKSADTLRSQLESVFFYLTCDEVDALSASRRLCKRMIEDGRDEDAGLISQSWNRLLSALDMMNRLLGEEPLAISELYQTLSNALDVSIIKVLPQSADSVYMQTSNAMLQQHTRVIFAMGLCDRGTDKDNILLLPPQQKFLSSETGAYLGPDEEDGPLQRRYYLKESLRMAADQLFISCSLGGSDASSNKRGSEFQTYTAVFPNSHELSESYFEKLLISSIEPAFKYAALSFSSSTEEPGLLAISSLRKLSEHSPEIADRLNRLDLLSAGKNNNESVSSDHTNDLYDQLTDISITRLELFSSCPYSHFIRYGLKPDLIIPFEMTSSDAGSFLHNCMNIFLDTCKDRLNLMTGEESASIMRRIADQYIRTIDKAADLIESKPSVRSQFDDLVDRACNCATVIAKHMRNSSFRIVDTEMSFSSPLYLLAPDDTTIFKGSVDRIDTWNDGKRVRVIDFKSSSRSLDPSSMLDGSALQLAVYMDIAKESTQSDCAGMYYFPMLDGYINSDSRNPIELNKARENEMRMSGILPADPEINIAQSPYLEEVFNISYKKDGTLDKGITATDQDFDRLINHAKAKSAEHLTSIRNGTADIYPLKDKKNNQCDYCDHRSACFFDPSLQKKRTLRSVTWEEFFTELALKS